MLIDTIKLSLENMNKKFTDLSRLQFDDISRNLREKLQEQKIQERPFAYEFYHQFRKLWDSSGFNDIVIQAEVNKCYQYIPDLNRIPDFLLHKPSTNKRNFAVIEFKVTSNNYTPLEEDFKKLIAFEQELKYKHLVEVVIGQRDSLEKAEDYIKEKNCSDGKEIIIIYFNTELWKANDFKIRLNNPIRE